MDNSKEFWKDVSGYEGLYQVSNLGRVKSFWYSKCRILKPCVNKKGYYLINLSKDTNIKSFSVHQLVAIAFLNHKPNGTNMVVNHINFNKLDNNVSNLEIVTSRVNGNLKHVKSSSKYTGVCWSKCAKKWISSITINSKSKYLGSFDNEIDAHLAYEDMFNSIS